MDNCKVIAITNQKGGVGKTTTTVNLGVGLNKFYGKKVLLLDADPQSSLTIALGNKNPDALDDTLASAMNAVIDDRPFDETAGILHHSEGVDLLPSNIELSGMEVGLFNVMSREYVLRNYIDTVRKNYDYVLIDCMPSLGMMTINALAAADSVIIPSQPSFLSAKGLDLLLRSISKVKRSINPDLKIDGILLTRHNDRLVHSREIREMIQETADQIGTRVYDAKIRESVLIREATTSGKSIFDYAPRSRQADDYWGFISEFLENGN